MKESQNKGVTQKKDKVEKISPSQAFFALDSLHELAMNLNIPEMAEDVEKMIESLPGRDPTPREVFRNTILNFSVAEAVLERMGRDEAKRHLGPIYNALIYLNNSNGQITPLAEWNPQGYLTKDQFDMLNRRRKKLSNDIGIMTASGVVRHDLNKI